MYYCKIAFLSKQIHLRLFQLIRITCPDVEYDAGTETCQCCKKLYFQGKIKWIIQVIIPLLSKTEGYVFTIELNMN